MKDAKGHGSNKRGTHAVGIAALPTKQNVALNPTSGFSRLMPSVKHRSIDDLPDETKLDIAQTLMDRVPALNEFANGDVNYVLQAIVGAAPTLMVETRSVPPNSIDNRKRSVSAAAVEKYAALGSKPPPIVMSGNSLIEGGHRVAAANKAGRTLEAVDVSKLLQMNWGAWLNGEDQKK